MGGGGCTSDAAFGEPGITPFGGVSWHGSVPIVISGDETLVSRMADRAVGAAEGSAAWWTACS